MAFEKEIFVASRNKGKIKEFCKLLGADWNVRSACEEKIPPFPPENFKTYYENALQKAHHAFAYSQCPSLADDSGLEVDALDGAPGISSARFGGEGLNDAERWALLLKKMESVPDALRTCRFRTVIALVTKAEEKTFDGVWEGKILREPKGRHGFGYDPIFFIPELNCASAELSAEEKGRFSHRAKALMKLKDYLSSLKPNGIS